MKTYLLNVSWTLLGHMYVNAESEDEAIRIAMNSEDPMPDADSYLDDSFNVDSVEEV